MNGFETILPFLKSIEHLILDESISEVMVNGPDRIFIEKAGFIEPVQGVNLGEKSLMVAVKRSSAKLRGTAPPKNQIRRVMHASPSPKPRRNCNVEQLSRSPVRTVRPTQANPLTSREEDCWNG